MAIGRGSIFSCFRPGRPCLRPPMASMLHPSPFSHCTHRSAHSYFTSNPGPSSENLDGHLEVSLAYGVPMRGRFLYGISLSHLYPPRCRCRCRLVRTETGVLRACLCICCSNVTRLFHPFLHAMSIPDGSICKPLTSRSARYVQMAYP